MVWGHYLRQWVVEESGGFISESSRTRRIADIFYFPNNNLAIHIQNYFPIRTIDSNTPLYKEIKRITKSKENEYNQSIGYVKRINLPKADLEKLLEAIPNITETQEFVKKKYQSKNL